MIQTLEISVDRSDEINLCVRVVAATQAHSRSVSFLVPAREQEKRPDGVLQLSLTAFETTSPLQEVVSDFDLEAEFYLENIDPDNFWGDGRALQGVRVFDSYGFEEAALSLMIAPRPFERPPVHLGLEE